MPVEPESEREPTTSVAASAEKKRSRGRPRATRDQQQARRQALIQAAFEEFTERGYRNTSIGDITARAGVSHGAYYQSFETKREMIDEAFDYAAEFIMGQIFDDVDPGSAASLEELVSQGVGVIHRVEDTLRERPGIARILAMEMLSVDDQLTRRWFGLVEIMIGLATLFLDNGVSKGFLRADLDTSATARALFGATLIPILGLGAGTQRAEDLDGYLEAGVRLVMEGIGPGRS